MGLMDKLKNMFTEEVEEEPKPIKKDMIQVEIPAAKSDTKAPETVEKEIKDHPSLIQPETPKREEKFVFPVYFDDKDFDELDKPKEKSTPLPSKEPYSGSKPQPSKDTKKVFKPSPVISPVYGVLDKNYSKDSIVTKKRPSNELRSYHASTLTVEDVRRKAFGRLEDDLENTLTYERKESFFIDDNEGLKQEVDIIDDLDLKKEEYPEEEYKDNDMFDDMLGAPEEVPETNYRHAPNEDNMVEEELNKIDSKVDSKNDKLVESDLFNLIDSMYRGKEDE